MAIIKKTKNNIAKDVEKRKSLCTAGGHVNWFDHYKNNMNVPEKIKKS